MEKEGEEMPAESGENFDVYDENTGNIDHVRDRQEPDNASEVVIDQASSSGLQADSADEAQTGPTPPPPKRTTSQAGRSEFRSRGPSETEAGASDEDGDRSIVKGPRLPGVNCPEKIIICLDLASEVNRVPFLQRDGTKHLPIELVKRALSMFIRTKSNINPRHQFALVVLQESAVWLQDFTSDVEEFLNVMFDLTSETRDCESCDLTSLFETIVHKVELPVIEDIEVLPPPYIVRTLFFYGRSALIPEFDNGREAQVALSASPYFFFDVFYLHEPPSEENCCKDIYDVFLDLDKNNTSYIHEVGRNTTNLYNRMASLVAHPLQRPEQVFALYSLDTDK
ncbi:BRISC and BRCA1-A complex member 1 [Strongylocentrotus purpuratus]|uniref:BRISC and BRCA1-A complex member 1 n=1 Tax=Strongylocentrotus purpuratus TaxID=7668 RepID=A0A7M7NI03_STRPU|nr:BRISC and BRCA1-A complex member 1 [Strongylocentrotus purpuratus]XP_030835939.1 BRISC and BRCA1-A complex member 1 [Strongylocentrotus purpuratus]|eukprot:XP_011674307.1 PREDICTED: BRISC and BRCA1-A complex member 1 [Strongylocentrotus purpuratus]